MYKKEIPHIHTYIYASFYFSKATTTTTASISTTSSATNNEDEASAPALFSISGIDQEMHIYVIYII